MSDAIEDQRGRARAEQGELLEPEPLPGLRIPVDDTPG
jgi:hypothetical protein